MPIDRTNPYAGIYRGFAEETARHELTVLHDDGLYRHLRMRAPGTLMWGWDVVTWPGHLATSGDIADGYVFTRDTDMLEFFRVPPYSRNYYADGAPCIDIGYWAEKLVGPDAYQRVRRYCHDLFLEQACTALHENAELSARAITMTRSGTDPDGGPLWMNPDPAEADRLQARRDAFLSDLGDVDPDEGLPGAQRFLADHEDVVGDDWWEWDLTDFDPCFVRACYALELTARTWSRRTAAAI